MQTSFICETEEPQKEMTSFENVSHTLFIPAPLIQNHNAQWSGNDDFFFFPWIHVWKIWVISHRMHLPVSIESSFIFGIG